MTSPWLDAGLARPACPSSTWLDQRAVGRRRGRRPAAVVKSRLPIVDAEVAAAAPSPSRAAAAGSPCRVLTGTAKPMFSAPQLMAVAMPTTSPAHVDQRAAGVAEVDRGVGLDEVLERDVADAERPPLGADHADGDRLVEVAAGCRSPSPSRPPARASLSPSSQVAQAAAGVDLEQGEVGGRVGALDLGRVVAVAEVDLAPRSRPR